jgi:hypothetical protein
VPDTWDQDVTVVAGELGDAAAIDRAVQDAEAMILSQPAVSRPG